MKVIKIIVVSVLSIYLLIAGILYISQESILFLATPLDRDYAYDFDTPFEEGFLQRPDGAEINYLHFKADSSRGMMVYYHGNAGDLARWGLLMQPLMKYGYDIFIMDYRGYGKSKGSRSSKKLYGDAQAFYEKALEFYPEEQLVVYGRSLGCTFATKVAADNRPKQLILETPFYSLRSVVKTAYPFLPADALLDFQFPTFRYIKEVKAPVLFLHGTLDVVVPYENGKRLYEAAIEKELVSIPGGTHNSLSAFSAYWEAMDKVLGQPREDLK